MALPRSLVDASADQRATPRPAGAVGEAFGHSYDESGRLIVTERHSRVIAMDLEAMRNRDVLIVAGGPEKIASLRAMLKTGLANALITDEATAIALNVAD